MLQSTVDPYSSQWHRIKIHFDEIMGAIQQLASMGHKLGLTFVDKVEGLSPAPQIDHTLAAHEAVFKLAGVPEVKREAQQSLGAPGAALVGQQPVDVRGKSQFEDSERMMTVGAPGHDPKKADIVGSSPPGPPLDPPGPQPVVPPVDPASPPLHEPEPIVPPVEPTPAT